MSDYKIKEALNIETGQFISADDYFAQGENEVWRERIRVEQIRQAEHRDIYVCPCCQ